MQLQDVVVALRRDGDILIADVDCEVDMGSAPAVERLIEESMQDASGLVVSLARCGHFDSNGIRVLVRFSRKLGMRFAVDAPRGTAARRVLDLTAELTRLRVRQTVADALALVRNDSMSARTRG